MRKNLLDEWRKKTKRVAETRRLRGKWLPLSSKHGTVEVRLSRRERIHIQKVIVRLPDYIDREDFIPFRF